MPIHVLFLFVITVHRWPIFLHPSLQSYQAWDSQHGCPRGYGNFYFLSIFCGCFGKFGLHIWIHFINSFVSKIVLTYCEERNVLNSYLEKLGKFEAQGQEYLKLFMKIILKMIGQTNFWNRILFQLFTGFYRSNTFGPSKCQL